MRAKVAKVFFILSYIVPVLIILLNGFLGLAFGADGLFGRELTGWDAFWDNIFWSFLVLIIIPLIPLCIVYQIAYLLRRFVKPIREMSLAKYIIIIICICLVITGIVLLYAFRFEIEEITARNKAEHLLERADTVIEYNLNEPRRGGLYDIKECQYDRIMIDHDTMTLGVLYYSSFDDFRRYHLEEIAPDDESVRKCKEEYYVNAVFPLNDSSRLISFYPDGKSMKHRTIAFILETGDGKTYYVNNLNDDLDTEFFGFSGCEYYVDGLVRYDELHP